jgi:hypothetical protein
VNSIDKVEGLKLIIPIISNGLVIFFVQKFYMNKIEKSIRNASRVEKVIQQFKQELIKMLTLLAEFKYEGTDKTVGYINRFGEIVIKEFNPYYLANKNTLQQHDKKINQFITTYNLFSDSLKLRDIPLAAKHINSMEDILTELCKESDLRLTRI